MEINKEKKRRRRSENMKMLPLCTMRRREEAEVQRREDGEKGMIVIPVQKLVSTREVHDNFFKKSHRR